MDEYTELQLRAKAAGIKSWHVKSDEVLTVELDAINNEPDAMTEQPPVDESTTASVEEVTEEPILPPVVAKPKPKGKVTFFWKNKRNIEFTIETRKATATSLRQAESFASKDSVLVLDPSNPVEKQAIDKLRKSPKFKVDFDEVDNKRVSASEKGAKLDALMELDKSVLVQMVGGSIPDSRKTRGELIQQIMAE